MKLTRTNKRRMSEALNEKEESKIFTFSLYRENGDTTVWITTDDSSGAEYQANTPEQLGKAVARYMWNYYPEYFE